MKKIILLGAVLIGSSGFSAARDSAQQTLPIAENPFATEHCKMFNEVNVCYLELVETDGAVSFQTTKENLRYLNLDERKARVAGLNIQSVSASEYEETRLNTRAETLDYGVVRGAFRFDTQCSLGISGGLLTGGLAGGATFGPVGVAAGALGGGLLALADFCFG
ncbi:MAG: hypothetical protein EOP04_22250 [Proteobacteria bacterium]|nr:MAG: hypothetical protein EOP04_22250 [Pseudomonadota bacterium]